MSIDTEAIVEAIEDIEMQLRLVSNPVVLSCLKAEYNVLMVILRAIDSGGKK